MSTTISKSFYSYQSDSSISASLSAQWGAIGGSASGGSSSHALTQSWKESADYTTVADGGDPSINSFANSDEWSKWARSVETGSPIVTTYMLTPLSDLIADQGKQANFDRAVQEYGAKYNVTAPAADLVNVTMDWCDCEYMHAGTIADSERWPPTGSPGCDGSKQVFVEGVCDQGKVFVGSQYHLQGGRLDACGDSGTGVGWEMLPPLLHCPKLTTIPKADLIGVGFTE